MKKLAAVILGTLLMMSSTLADGTAGAGEHLTPPSSSCPCGDCTNQGARGQTEVDETPSSPVLTDEQKERGV